MWERTEDAYMLEPLTTLTYKHTCMDIHDGLAPVHLPLSLTHTHT